MPKSGGYQANWNYYIDIKIKCGCHECKKIHIEIKCRSRMFAFDKSLIAEQSGNIKFKCLSIRNDGKTQRYPTESANSAFALKLNVMILFCNFFASPLSSACF